MSKSKELSKLKKFMEGDLVSSEGEEKLVEKEVPHFQPTLLDPCNLKLQDEVDGWMFSGGEKTAEKRMFVTQTRVVNGVLKQQTFELV